MGKRVHKHAADVALGDEVAEGPRHDLVDVESPLVDEVRACGEPSRVEHDGEDLAQNRCCTLVAGGGVALHPDTINDGRVWLAGEVVEVRAPALGVRLALTVWDGDGNGRSGGSVLMTVMVRKHVAQTQGQEPSSEPGRTEELLLTPLVPRLLP